MFETKLARGGVILLITLALFIGAAYFYWTRGVCVSITNNTETTIENVDIAYWRGVIHIGALKPKTSRARYVNPPGESDLTLEWFDVSGVKHARRLGVYIETNYAGSIQVTVESGNRVSVTEKVRLRAFDWRSVSGTHLLQDDANAVR